MWYIVWALFMAYGIYLFVLIWMRQSSAKVVSAEEFGKDLRHGQLIDVREKDEFKAAHILGARNIPYCQSLVVALTVLRKMDIQISLF